MQWVVAEMVGQEGEADAVDSVREGQLAAGRGVR
jgi:hypothetical protein